jgi:hypothetical protein
MHHRRSESLRGLLFLVLLSLAPLPALGEETPAPEVGAVRFRYGVARHQALFLDAGVARPADGLAADDVSLSALIFGEGPLGASFLVGRELITFAVGDAGGGFHQSLARLRVGPSGRLIMGPVVLDATFAYELAQLPLWSGEVGPPQVGWHHAVVVSPRVRVVLPWELRLELSAELPLSLWAGSSGGEPMERQAAGLGIALGRQLGRMDRLTYGLLLDFHAATSDASRGVGDAAYLRTARVGLVAELAWDAAPSSDF